MAKAEVPDIDAATLKQKIEGKMTNTEFCAAFGLSTVTAWRYRKDGTLPFSRIAGKVFYLPKHIEEFLRRTENKSRAKHGSENVTEGRKHDEVS